MDRITVIRKSLVVFVCGLIGFLPIVGLVPGIYALVLSTRIQLTYRKQWNPARAYLRAGGLLALLGFLGSMLIVGIVLTTVAF